MYFTWHLSKISSGTTTVHRSAHSQYQRSYPHRDRAAQEQINLLLGIPKLRQIIDTIGTRLYTQWCIQVGLFTVLVDTAAFEHKPFGVAWLEGTNLEDGVYVELTGYNGG